MEPKQCSNREEIIRSLRVALGLADTDAQLARRIREALERAEWLSALDALPSVPK